MKKADFLIAVTALMFLLTACQDRVKATAESSPDVAGSPPASPTIAPAKTGNATDKWLGQWNGPEGTFLLLSRKGAHYEVKVQSLDGPNTYEGVVAGDCIEFKRDGKTESIRAGSGKDTGMKWLLEKKDCLIIREGEGFCGG